MDNQTQTSNDKDILATIDTLDMSDSMKTKIRLVHDNFIKVKFGVPCYKLKGFSSITLMSFLAFFFTFIYYLIKCMWKKAITLLMFNIILGIAFIFLSELLNTPQISGFGNIIISCIALQSAYYDIYRKKVLKENFWW